VYNIDFRVNFNDKLCNVVDFGVYFNDKFAFKDNITRHTHDWRRQQHKHVLDRFAAGFQQVFDRCMSACDHTNTSQWPGSWLGRITECGSMQLCC